MRLKIFNGTFAIIFALFAYYQFNDPDPVIWVLCYAYVALVCLLGLISKIRKFYLIVGIVVFTALAIYHFPGVIAWVNSEESEAIFRGMDRNKPYLEETREFFGLLIGLMVLIINWIRR